MHHSQQIEIVAPSRLHFGMLSFGQPGMRQFGGVGAMVDTPCLRLKFVPAERLSASGPQAERAMHFARLAVENWKLATEPRCHITVQKAPDPHVGLGSGTQLAMSVAAGLSAFLGREPVGPKALACAVGRGLRSAIGLYGFAHGGLLVESGKAATDAASSLAARVQLPAHWRFVLLCPAGQPGLFGAEEQSAFAQLPPVPLETTNRLAGEILLHLLPAAVAGDFPEFSESLFRYGQLSGTCFARCQGDAFAHPELVEKLRNWGIRGVGQSSWGPTLFALAPDEDFAQHLVDRIRSDRGATELTAQVVRPANEGALLNGVAITRCH